MKANACLSLCVLGLLALAGSAAGQPQIAPPNPGLSIFPFAGTAAGLPPLSAPKFGVMDMPAGPLGGMMYVSELNGNEVSLIRPSGMEVPFTMMTGPTPFRTLGVDIDGPIMGQPFPTRGMWGGPAFMSIAQGSPPVNVGGYPVLRSPMPAGPPGGWIPTFMVPGSPGMAQLMFDRTPGFQYGGWMFYSDWGGDQTDAIFVCGPNGVMGQFTALPGLDPRYFTFDVLKLAGYGPGSLWVTSFNSGQVFSILPNGVRGPVHAVLAPGIEGLAFGLGDRLFGPWMYVANLTMGTIDIVGPGPGMVRPFAFGFPGAAYLIFADHGPYARNGEMTLYVLDGNDSIWQIVHCPQDWNYDGNVDPDDLGDYINCYFSIPPCPRADFNNDGNIDPDDLGDMINLYFGPPC